MRVWGKKKSRSAFLKLFTSRTVKTPKETWPNAMEWPKSLSTILNPRGLIPELKANPNPQQFSKIMSGRVLRTSYLIFPMGQNYLGHSDTLELKKASLPSPRFLIPLCQVSNPPLPGFIHNLPRPIGSRGGKDFYRTRFLLVPHVRVHPGVVRCQ